MFWLTQNRFLGLYFVLMETSRERRAMLLTAGDFYQAQRRIAVRLAVDGDRVVVIKFWS